MLLNRLLEIRIHFFFFLVKVSYLSPNEFSGGAVKCDKVCIHFRYRGVHACERCDRKSIKQIVGAW